MAKHRKPQTEASDPSNVLPQLEYNLTEEEKVAVRQQVSILTATRDGLATAALESAAYKGALKIAEDKVDRYATLYRQHEEAFTQKTREMMTAKGIDLVNGSGQWQLDFATLTIRKVTPQAPPPPAPPPASTPPSSGGLTPS